MLYHAEVSATPGGFVGVDIFFVISGFLITGLLMRELLASGRIKYSHFLARRARRLLPAALAVIAFVGIASTFVYPPLERLDVISAARAASLYVANVWFGARAIDYLGGAAATNPMLHMWSLAVEEQFYLAWPLALAFVGSWLTFSDPRLRILSFVATVTAVSFAICIWITQVAQPWAFFGTPFRAWEFGLGALVYLASDRIRRLPSSALSLAGTVGLLLVVGSTAVLTDSAPFPGAIALIPVGGTALILASASVSGPVRSLLSTRALARVGDVSYSWYLWHWPLLVMLPVLIPGDRFTILAAAVVTSYAVAEVSYRYIEEPFRRGFARRIRPRTIMLGTLTITLCTAFLLTVGKNGASSATLTARQQHFINARKDISPVFGKGCHVDIWQTEVAECEGGEKKSSQIAVLLGDSHAAHWFPALDHVATLQGWKLVSMTKSGCPWVDVPVQLLQLRREYAECKVWRDRAFSRIREIRPLVVVVANSHRKDVGIEEWELGARRSTTALSESGAKVVLIRDTPRPGFDAPACLARADHIGIEPARACTFSLSSQLERGVPIFETERRAVTALQRSVIIDLSLNICPQDKCSVISDEVVRFSDSSHLTATFSGQLADELAAQLRE